MKHNRFFAERTGRELSRTMGFNEASPSDFEPSTSPSLLMRIRNPEDTDSWHYFEAVYSPIVRRYCQRRGIQESDIDDITQDVMTAVARAIRNFDYQPSLGKFRGWFATITANQLKTFFKRQKYSPPEINGILNDLECSQEADSVWSDIFLEQVFDIACQRVRLEVEPRTWASFQATWLEGSQPRAVAEELGLPIHTIYVNKSRVLKKLEKEFLLLTDDFPLPHS